MCPIGEPLSAMSHARPGWGMAPAGGTVELEQGSPPVASLALYSLYRGGCGHFPRAWPRARTGAMDLLSPTRAARADDAHGAVDVLPSLCGALAAHGALG